MKILKNAKNISIFLSAFVLGGIVTVIFLKNTGIFTGRKQISAEKGAAAKPKPKMKMVKGGVMVSMVQRQLYGIKVGKAKLMKLTRKIKTIGEVDYSVPLEKTVTLKYGGYVKNLFVNKPGMSVYKGEPLFTVYSPELVDSEKDFMLAYKNYIKLKKSDFNFGIKEAKSFLNSSAFRLKRFGVTNSQLNMLKMGMLILTNTTVHSPVNGVFLKKSIFSGSYFNAGQPLYKLAGLSRVWMNIWVYEKDMPFVKTGETVSVRFNAYPGRVFYGRVSFIYPYLAGKKRVDEVRLVFNNSKGEIKPGMYGNAEIMIKSEKVIAVPTSAVLITGAKPLVFVYKGKGYFMPEYVVIGTRYGGYYPVISGLKNGERIVVSGTFLMSSDSNLSQAVGSMAGMPGMSGMSNNSNLSQKTSFKAGTQAISNNMGRTKKTSSMTGMPGM
ncbi:MAG: efflux RND transporter periplasmic adaptor subunit [Candidatus Acidulodesulfobacterium acidiphilum]|uniref:Efflux RND transporter periplasmic adaptor subunit n=1 Tax=Candidatus Acidulodesulfobacterium acidiphilum TaxID=2597224 RepID=A0A520X8R9_9DELT|nr:MAG: efflux RND transporter periplasmic adaptor subunit [Candidatus Acidulodesulfobacterium acidiphilum]